VNRGVPGLDEYELNLLQAMVESYLNGICSIWPGATFVFSKRPEEDGSFSNTIGYLHREHRNLSRLHVGGLIREGHPATTEDEWDLSEKVAYNFDLTKVVAYLSGKGLPVRYDTSEFDSVKTQH
jgi:hypothetical protein